MSVDAGLATQKGSYLPESCAHIFYHRRVNYINDNLPKYSGFISSQTLFTKKLVLGMLGRKKIHNKGDQVRTGNKSPTLMGMAPRILLPAGATQRQF